MGRPGLAGSFGRSAAVGQVLPPRPQMVGKQDWRYVSGGGQVTYGAHSRDCEITSLAFSADDNTLLSRATDDTLKVPPPPCSPVLTHPFPAAVAPPPD